MGIWSGGPVGLVHTRLAIIDLGGSGQPMSSPSGSHHLVFNGEILNYRQIRRTTPYRYQSDGDTEVLLALYQKFGLSGVTQLRGQFAYAIYDVITDEMHLFRDRLGILPLYYYFDDNKFAFASEIKALFPVMDSIAIDRESVDEYLAHRSIPSPHSLIKGVRKLPPGCYLTVRADGSHRVSSYWSLSIDRACSTMSDADSVRSVDSALRSSVGDALIADVPVGVYLSGGVDSSLLTVLARKANPDQILHTFGASFSDRRYDESGWAHRVSSLVKSQHHEIAVSSEDFLENWARLSWNRDGPLSEPADVAIYLLAEQAREHVKVVLSGEGADELFGGYPKHIFAGPSRWMGAVPGVRLIGKNLEHRLPARFARMRIAMRALSESSYPERLRAWFAPFTVAEREKLTGCTATRVVPIPYRHSQGDGLQRMLYSDTCSWLSDNLLERGDRMAMAASLETRPPFLDYRLVELAFALPNSSKVRGLTTKWVIKEVARQYLPGDLVDRPKIGFRVPLDVWFRHGLRDMAFDLLTSSTSYSANYFDKSMVRRLLDDHLTGRRNEESRVWTLLSFEIWYRELVVRECLDHTFVSNS